MKRYDNNKFRNIVHYVIWRAGDLPGFGATKLNKVLWFSDARMYVLTGSSITGAVYIRQKYGPVAHQMLPVQSDLTSSGAIKIKRDRLYNRPITRFKALKAAKLVNCTEDEIQTINWWVDHIAKDHTAASISDESHDYGWEIYEIGEEIPYRAFLSERVREEMRPDDKRWAEKRAKELGLH